MPQLKYLIIDNFLPAPDHAAVLAFALANQAGFAPAEVRTGTAGRYSPEIRDSMIFQPPLGEIGQRFEAALFAIKEQVFARTGTPPFAIMRCETELAVHRDGCFFASHQDTFTQADRTGTRSDRLISAVWYCHAEPRGFSGGELALYPFDKGEPAVIEPVNNRLVAFPSFALHEVRPVSCPGDAFAQARFSINCWLRRARSVT